MNHRVEYLITVDQKDQFCKTTAGFNNLLKTIEGVAISNGDLSWSGMKVGYEVQDGEIQKDKQRFFHAKFTLKDDAMLERFEEFLRSVRGVLSKAGGRPPQVLWDGVSSNYARNAYPLVHEIENTLRKLITKFMLINVGLGWTREAIPIEVQESVRTKDKKLDHDYLYEVDFIQLSNFLFKEYATTNASALIDRVRQAQKIEDLELEELKKAIPKSNWDRFFSKVVNCENEYLQSRWKALYERRNQIAHNRPIGRSEYDEIVRLKEELHPKFLQAIENLDQLKITEDERELVSENVATSKSESYSEFISTWNEFHMNLYKLASILSAASKKSDLVKDKGTNVRNLVNVLTKDFKVLSPAQRKESQELLRLRNYMIHEPTVIVQPNAIAASIERTQDLLRTLKNKIAEVAEHGLSNTEIGDSNTEDSTEEQEDDA
ncbi:MAG: hypothetical protein EOP50_00985 [Sphingobacteriales bacterium]|nr:MAG: hypothetical protein EOP50_00985 [Sphingobacteriales bacterium]